MDKSEIMKFKDGETMVTQLQKLAEDCPHKPAYIFVDKDFTHRVLTRQEVWDKGRKFSVILNRLGIGKGDIVCNSLVNSPERLITGFGTMLSGAISSHGQVLLANGEDLINNLKDSKCKAIIVDPGDQNGASVILDKIKFTDEETGASRYKDLPELSEVIEVKACGVEESQRLIASIDTEEDMFVDESILQDDIAVAFSTSGTTGFSKLVLHTHRTLMNAYALFTEVSGSYGETVLFNMQSQGWIGGYPAYYIVSGNTRILLDVTNGLPENLGNFLVRMFNKNKVNVAFLISRDIHLVVNSLAEENQLDMSFKTILTGGSPVHKVTVEAVWKIADRFVGTYGGTEIGLAAFNEVTSKSEFQDMCAGIPRHSDIKIVDKKEEEVPLGKLGELFIRSATLFKGYLNNQTKTAEAFTEDGWYKTGDIGYFNKDGVLFVLCRKADAINKDGFIHYPGWMEKLINNIPGIEKNVVFGIPDPIHNEEICLCIQPQAGEELTQEALRDHCKKLFLTDENASITPLPKHYVFFDKILTNANGKVNRKELREEVLKRLEL